MKIEDFSVKEYLELGERIVCMMERMHQAIKDPNALKEEIDAPAEPAQSDDLQISQPELLPFSNGKEIMPVRKRNCFIHRVQIKWSCLKNAKTYPSIKFTGLDINGQIHKIHIAEAQDHAKNVIMVKRAIQRLLDRERPGETIEKITRWDINGNEYSA